MITAAEIEKKVETEQGRLSELHLRMDGDFDRWDLEETEFDSHKTAINVTTNNPRLFADDLQSTLSRANMQPIVRMAEKKGADNRDDISKLERLFDFALEKADELLSRKLLPPLRDTVIWHGLIRGCRAGRFLAYNDDNKVIFDFLPWDPRWITYKVGANGLIWAAYKMFMTEEAIVDEWEVKPGTSLLDTLKKFVPFTSKGKVFEVIDYWAIPDSKKPTEIQNAVVSGGSFLKNPEILDLPSMPISIRPVAVSPPISKDSHLIASGYGEGIYAPNRATYELLNRLYSIEATRANLLSKQPVINYYKSDGQTGLKDTVMQADAVIDIPEETNRFEALPMKEVPVTLLDMIDKLNVMRERAETPYMDIGKPPPSGTLFGLVQEAGEKVYVPQLRNLSLFYGDIFRLVEEQLIAGKLKVDVETEAKRKYYKTKVTPVDLKKPHIIKVELTSRSPWMEFETYQISDMAKRLGLPDEFIWEHILKLPDPKGLGDQVAVEIAEHSPKLMRLRAIKVLIEQGREEEAQDLIDELYQEWLQQQIQPEAPMGEQTGQPEVTSA